MERDSCEPLAANKGMTAQIPKRGAQALLCEKKDRMKILTFVCKVQQVIQNDTIQFTFDNNPFGSWVAMDQKGQEFKKKRKIIRKGWNLQLKNRKGS